MKVSKCLAALLALPMALWAGETAPFTLTDSDNLKLDWRGTPLVLGERFNWLNEDGLAKYPHRRETVNGSDVTNHFDEKSDIPFRREIAVKAGGKEVEVSIQFNIPAYSAGADDQPKSYALSLPFAAFAGWNYEAVIGRVSKAHTVTGVIDPNARSGARLVADSSIRQVRLTAPDGSRSIVIDCSPEGVNDFYSDYPPNGIQEIWSFYRDGDVIKLGVGYTPRFYGGSQSAKVVFYEGTPENLYPVRHAQKNYRYYSELPTDRQYVLGADKFGKSYTPIHTAAFDAKSGAGWVDAKALNKVNFRPSGALYSAVQSKANNTFRMTGLRRGVHLVTLGVSSFDRPIAGMSVTVNGTRMLDQFSAPARTVTMVTLPIWIENGQADIAFSGAWQVSTISDQLLQSSAEDLSFRRGFWVSTKGPHPSVMFHSEHYAKEPVFEVGISQYPLPEPGKEMAKPRKELVYTTGHGDFSGNDWRSGAVIAGLGTSNNGSFAEFSAPGMVERRVKELQDENITFLLTNGLLSRHTYPCHQSRIRQMLQRLTKEAHSRGMHVVDHWDFSLLWNCDSGFRVMTERTNELQRTIDCGLPNRGLCPSNPRARKTVAEELKRYITEGGIDGIMIDEVNYHTANFCGCSYCRKQFTADTGWELPADETSPELNNKLSPLWRAWQFWRQKAIGDFWVALREEVRPLRKDFLFIGYTTHYGIYSDYSSTQTAGAMEQLCRAWDFVGTEIMSRNGFASYRSVASFRRMKNMFRNVNQVPVFGLVYSSARDWNVLYFGWALNNMNAQSTWEMSGVQCPSGAANYRLFDEKAGNMVAATARSKAKIALLFSTHGRDCNRGASSHTEVMGISQILGAHHVPHEFIYEAGLTPEVLKNYDMLVVGNATAMSKADVDAVAAYVKAGGVVWMANFAGYFNGVCMKEDHWYAGQKLLAGSDYGKRESGERFTALRDPASGETWTLEGKNAYLPQKLSPQLTTIMELTHGDKTVFPGLVSNRLGKGVVYYTPAALAASSAAFEVTPNDVVKFEVKPNSEAAVWAVFRKIAPASAMVWETKNVPDQVITSIYQVPGDKICVHFLNATRSNLKPGDKVPGNAPADAFAPLDGEMSFTIASEAQKAYAVSPEWQGKRDLPLTRNGKNVTVTIPGKTLGAYMIVYLEK